MLAGLMLIASPPAPQDQLIIEDHGKTIAQVSRSEFTAPGLPVIDRQKLDQFIAKLSDKTVRSPVNATLGPNHQIVAERAGYTLDRENFIDQFQHFFYSKQSARVIVPLQKVYPEVDSELLSEIRTQRIGTYMTYFNPGNKARTHNIELAVRSINNQVVFPGRIFSFNRTLGQRTRQKGYQTARIIVKGEYSEGIGGGICQVSSTLFNAADRAGLHIVERYAHSKRVAYVPPGRDATVSWMGPDFRFRNSYGLPVLIRASSSGGRVIFSFYSSSVIRANPRTVPAPAHETGCKPAEDRKNRAEDR
ncbi:VanW family protein [Sporolactobacillus vineae]|uniref:VanW family protein n=1 Tax=Sporolactobacillus vineae TaxID=444463 RepID=UPI001EE63B76|nr:VanW family protein [Sporolactobacillus vineae]